MKIRKAFFKTLVTLNKSVLPSLKGKDPAKLSKNQRLLLGWKYWTLKNSKD